MGTSLGSRTWSTAALALLTVMAVSCRGEDKGTVRLPATETSAGPTTTAVGRTFAPADFTASVDHPLFSLSSVRSQTFEGTDREPGTGKSTKTRTEKRVLDKPEVIDGVPTTVLEVKEFEAGELIETTLDYFAQHRDGSVWYFGERIDNYEGGKVTGHKGQWRAGEGNAKPGIYLPAKPVAGQDFAQEQAPGVAEDRSTILEVGAEVTTPAGKFTDCIHVKDYSALDKAVEFKFYCPRVGIVREEEPNATSDLVRYG
jgi:hypothetical protein